MVRKIKKSWWIDFCFNHLRYRKRSPENSKTGACAYEVVLRQKLARGEDINGVDHQTITFEQFARRWFDEYVTANNKPSEQWSKKYILNASLIPFFGKMPIERITVNDVEKYKMQASKKGLAKKTINNQLTVFRTCVTTAYEWLELEGPPPKVTRLKCPQPETYYLSPGDCVSLLSYTDGIVREMVLTAMRTGMRQGEIRGLQWESIDWQDKSITVRHSLCDYTKELGSPKGNRERYIPMDADVYEMLSKRKKNTGYVFLNKNGKPFGSENLGDLLAKACKKAGMRHIGWHVLRHTFASQLAMGGAPLGSVQMLLGHTAIATTMRYAHLAQSTLRTAIGLLSPKRVLDLNSRQQAVNPWLEALRKEDAQKALALESLVIT